MCHFLEHLWIPGKMRHRACIIILVIYKGNSLPLFVWYDDTVQQKAFEAWDAGIILSWRLWEEPKKQKLSSTNIIFIIKLIYKKRLGVG